MQILNLDRNRSSLFVILFLEKDVISTLLDLLKKKLFCAVCDKCMIEKRCVLRV